MSEYNKELVEKVIKGMMKFRKFHHPKLSDDISRMEGSIIFWLVKSEKMENKSVNVSELAEGLHVSMQSISITLKSLENKGYIVREVDSDNRRNTLIKLSKKGNELVPAPQLRCPAEITYVFKNEPKVKEIVKTTFKLKKGETVKLTFEKLGISKNTDSFLMELEAKVEETSMLRYPYTLFHSTMPDKTAHMYGKIRIKEGK